MSVMKRKKTMVSDQFRSISESQQESRITESGEKGIAIAASVVNEKTQEKSPLIFDEYYYNHDENDDFKERWRSSTVACRSRDTSNYEFRWKTVMGTRRPVYSSSSAVTPILISRSQRRLCQPLFTFTFILLLGLCQGCKVEQCWRHYTHGIETQGIIQGPNLAYCLLLKTHSDCIRATARSCRGDLKYHSTSSLVSQWAMENNCTYTIQHSGTSPPVTKAPKPIQNTACMYHGRQVFQHCSLFGDPHLRTFQDESQTCKVLGAWPLIDNAYLAVQVTNEAVLPDSSATATTKVTVIIKDGGNKCTQHKMYEAQVDNVPTAFVDGTRSSSQGDDHFVRIKEKSPAPNSHIEIVIRYIATTIVIRQTGRYLIVAIRMPKDVVRQGVSPGAEGMQLCFNGCPAVERIPYKKMLAMPSHTTRAASRDEAMAKCKEYNVTDFYLDSCVFDLMTTGDLGFGEAASKAQQDLWRLNPKLAAEQRNRTVLSLTPDDFNKSDPGYRHNKDEELVMNSGPGRPTAQLLIYVLTLVITLSVFLQSN